MQKVRKQNLNLRKIPARVMKIQKQQEEKKSKKKKQKSKPVAKKPATEPQFTQEEEEQFEKDFQEGFDVPNKRYDLWKSLRKC